MGEYFHVRLWSLSFSCGRQRFESTFPTDAWEGHGTRNGLRNGSKTKKKEQWVIEIVQSCGSQCSCVGLHLCLARCKEKRTFGTTDQLPPCTSTQANAFTPWERKWNHKWAREKKKKEWGDEGNIYQSRPVRFLAVWPCGYKLILLWFGFLPTTKRIIKVTWQVSLSHISTAAVLLTKKKKLKKACHA